jgi:hypothetical protein
MLASIARLFTYINEKATTPKFWKDDWFMSRRYIPILHTLLSLPHYPLALASVEENQGLVIREAIRLTCLLLIAQTHRTFSIPPDQVRFYHSRLTSLLTKNAINWFPFLDLKLWVLAISGSVSEGEGRKWYVEQIRGVMGELGLSKTCEMMEVVKGVIWIEVPLEEGAERLVEEIQASISVEGDV